MCHLCNDLVQYEFGARRPRQLDLQPVYLRANAGTALETPSAIRQHPDSEPDEIDRLFRGVS